MSLLPTSACTKVRPAVLEETGLIVTSSHGTVRPCEIIKTSQLSQGWVCSCGNCDGGDDDDDNS